MIFLTARNEEKSVEDAFRAGAVDYVPKPFAASELRARVRNQLELQRMKNELLFLNHDLQLQVDTQVKQISAAHLAMIFAMARLAESRDPETGRHLERISGYVRCLLECLSSYPDFTRIIDDRYIEAVCRSAVLHDIGKVAIPDAVLQKPGRFNQEEYAVMQAHTTIGADTLRSVEQEFYGIDLIRYGIEIAEGHHEWWNGHGYPHRKQEEEIPLAARVVALADVFDALTQKRCYKPAFSFEESEAIIFNDEDGHFDPRLVNCLKEKRREFQAIYKNYQNLPQ